MTEFYDNNRCFVCGIKNPNGLKLSFRYNKDQNQLETEVIFPQHLQGWSGIVHGGLISTVLDEIVVKAAEIQNIKCVTAEINVKFKKPAYTGKIYFVLGKINETKKRLILAESFIMDSKKDLIATANAKLYIIK